MLKTVDYFGLMTIKWGLDFYDSEAHVYTKNRTIRWLLHQYLRIRGFKPVKIRKKL